jgi:hypothetical protein
MKRQSKRAWVLVAIAAIAGVMAAVGAYAYFTNTGTGTGTAEVGTSSGITLSGDAAGLLYPGGPARTATVTITNPGAGAQFVDTISGVVEDDGGCLGSWFEVDSITYQATLAPSASDTEDTLIRMLDPATPTNQDVCKGKTMNITWSSN